MLLSAPCLREAGREVKLVIVDEADAEVELVEMPVWGVVERRLWLGWQFWHVVSR
jgi:hypothetical protein